MVIGLSVIVPAIFVLGIGTRKEIPSLPASASGISTEVSNYSELWSRDDLWEKQSIRTRLLADGGSTGQFAVEFVSKDRIVRPDVIVYWVPGEQTILNSLPDEARLLGSFNQSNPVPLPLPAEAGKQPGVLVLYSLADHEILSVSKSLVIRF
jgi:hypothetical protein